MSEVALASFDVLHLASQLTASTDGVSEGELHTLAYLSCVLAVFEGRDPGWWGYSFAATKSGTPFAVSIRKAVEDSVRAGFLVKEDRVYTLTEMGSQELEAVAVLILNRRRERYLEAASATALTMPLPAVADALSYEPGLRNALQFMRTKALLDETSIALLEAQFESLGQAMDGQEIDDLLVPSVVWLTYLAQQRLIDQEAA